MTAADKKKIIIASVCLAVIAIGAGAYYKFHAGPDPSKMSGEQIRKFVTSQDFNSMPRQQRHEFFGKVMESRVNGYFQTPPQDRDKYLDKILDDMKNMRPPQGDSHRRPDPNMINRMRARNSSPEQRRARSEMRDPVQSQRNRNFFNALRTRAQQRGMQMPGGPRGGGPRM